MPAITLNYKSATEALLGLSAVEANAVRMEVQYGIDFSTALAPLVQYALAGQILLSGLNQGSRYQLRARTVFADNSRSDWSNVIKMFTPIATARSMVATGVMIEPALIVVPEDVAWTCAFEDSGHPAVLLGRDAPAQSFWMRKNVDRFVFEGAHGGYPVDTLALLGTTGSESSTITVTAGPTAANAASSSPVFSYGPVPFRASPNLDQRASYHCLLRFPAAVAQPFWRIVITGPAPGDLMAISYAVLGLARVTRALSADATESWQDGGSVTRDRTGAPTRLDGFRSRLVDFDLSLLTYAQFEANYRDLRDRVGLTSPIMIVTNSRRDAFLHDRILYGTLQTSRSSLPYSLRFNQSMSVLSLI